MKEYDANKVTEKGVEEYLRDRVKLLGGKAYKWVSPGNNGVQDRIVALPGKVIVFVELKAPGKKPTKDQRKQSNFLKSLGFVVILIDTKQKVDAFIASIDELPSNPKADEFLKSMRDAAVMTEF